MSIRLTMDEVVELQRAYRLVKATGIVSSYKRGRFLSTVDVIQNLRHHHGHQNITEVVLEVDIGERLELIALCRQAREAIGKVTDAVSHLEEALKRESVAVSMNEPASVHTGRTEGGEG